MKRLWTELAVAALAVCQANCRQHRERATLRLQNALETLSNHGEGFAPELDLLLTDLAKYAQDYQEDPKAAKLVVRCQKAGVLK